MAGKDYVGVLAVLRDQIENGFINIAPRCETDEPYRGQWKAMFIESLEAGIAALSNARPENF